MRSRFRRSLCSAAGVTLLLAACSSGSVLEPDADRTAWNDPSLASLVTLEEVCATVDFEGWTHGDAVSTVALPELELEFQVSVWPANGGLATARIYDTDTTSPPGDPFLAWAGSGASCPDCLGRGNVLAIEDGAGFPAGGASDFGGTFFLDGFSQPDVRVRGVTAVGSGSFDGSHAVSIDAEPIAGSTAAAGAVQLLVPTAEPAVQSFVELVILSSAQGGFDDLTLCRMMEATEPPPGPEVGGEGCGFGFWKNPKHLDQWAAAGVSPGLRVVDAFGSAPETLARPEQALAASDLTLGQSIALRGSGVNRFLREATAALLNANAGAVRYDLAPQQVLDLYSSAMAGGDTQEAADRLSDYNSQSCPLD